MILFTEKLVLSESPRYTKKVRKTKLCPNCKKNPTNGSHGYCLKCHAKYQRIYRRAGRMECQACGSRKVKYVVSRIKMKEFRDSESV